jgi:hypothetical protein
LSYINSVVKNKVLKQLLSGKTVRILSLGCPVNGYSGFYEFILQVYSH